MIFVAVGTARGFPRLVTKMDEIAGRLDEEVVMQIGNTSYKPVRARYFHFGNQEEIQRFMREARVVISHCGYTVAEAFILGKPVIVVPRLKDYNEVIDDNQLELCQALEKEGEITAVYDIEQLETALLNLKPQKSGLKSNGRLVNALKSYVNAFDASLAHKKGKQPKTSTPP